MRCPFVDQDTRTIERWTSASEFPETFRDGINWTPGGGLPPLAVSDADLFGARN